MILFEKVWELWSKYWYVFLDGLGGTLWIAAVTVLFASIIGMVLAVMKLSRIKIFNWIVDLLLWVVRGTPILLQLYFFWLFLPRAMPFLNLSDTQCILVALIINASAYVAEIVRAGIQAVDIGQTEAAKSLGMSNFNTMMRIVLPQAIKNILPAIGNEYITVVKSSSLASVFFINELTTSYKTVQSATFLAIESLLIAGVIYLFVTTVLTWVLNLFERRLQRSER